MGITLNQAAARIGAEVIYRSAAQREGRDRRPAEHGHIRRVGATYVFVAYGDTVAATHPSDLDFAVDAPALDEDDHKDRMIDAREAMSTMGVD